MHAKMFSRIFQNSWKNITTRGYSYQNKTFSATTFPITRKGIIISNLGQSVPHLCYLNCRKYKNFGHERDPPPTTYVKFYYLVLTAVPFLIWFNYKLFLYCLNEEWYDIIMKYVEPEVHHEGPNTPFVLQSTDAEF